MTNVRQVRGYVMTNGGCRDGGSHICHTSVLMNASTPPVSPPLSPPAVWQQHSLQCSKKENKILRIVLEMEERKNEKAKSSDCEPRRQLKV